MTITSNDRFSKGLNASTKFQKDEQNNRDGRDFAKLENIRKYQKTLMNKVDQEKKRNLERENSILKMVGLAQWSYEHVIFKF